MPFTSKFLTFYQLILFAVAFCTEDIYWALNLWNYAFSSILQVRYKIGNGCTTITGIVCVYVLCEGAL